MTGRQFLIKVIEEVYILHNSCSRTIPRTNCADFHVKANKTILHTCFLLWDTENVIWGRNRSYDASEHPSQRNDVLARSAESIFKLSGKALYEKTRNVRHINLANSSRPDERNARNQWRFTHLVVCLRMFSVLPQRLNSLLFQIQGEKTLTEWWRSR